VNVNRAIFDNRIWPHFLSRWFKALHHALRKVTVRRQERSLRLCETLPLGERRFLMVVEFERRRFLIGATSQSVSLLDRLDEKCHPAVATQEPRWGDALWKRPH
jgi:flagellar biogenesis protein FliO